MAAISRPSDLDRLKMKKIILILLSPALYAQIVIMQGTDQISTSRQVINNNFTYVDGRITSVDAKQLSGNGAPAVTCSAGTNLGNIYVRKDAAATLSSLYVCDQNGASTWSWELQTPPVQTVKWSDLANPSGNLSLSMGAYTTQLSGNGSFTSFSPTFTTTSGTLASWYNTPANAWSNLFGGVNYSVGQLGMIVQPAGSTNLYSSGVMGMAIQNDSTSGHVATGLAGQCGLNVSGGGCWGATAIATAGATGGPVPSSGTIFGIEADLATIAGATNIAGTAFFAYGGAAVGTTSITAGFQVNNLGGGSNSNNPWTWGYYSAKGVTNDGLFLECSNATATFSSGYTCTNGDSQGVFMNAQKAGVAVPNFIYGDRNGNVAVWPYSGSSPGTIPLAFGVSGTTSVVNASLGPLLVTSNGATTVEAATGSGLFLGTATAQNVEITDTILYLLNSAALNINAASGGVVMNGSTALSTTVVVPCGTLTFKNGSLTSKGAC